MSKRFEDYQQELFQENVLKQGELVSIPGTDIYENLCEFCDNATAINNYITTQSWANEFGEKYPKFVMVAYSMVLFKSFKILEKMLFGKYDKYDQIINGLWLHYISIPRKP